METKRRVRSFCSRREIAINYRDIYIHTLMLSTKKHLSPIVVFRPVTGRGGKDILSRLSYTRASITYSRNGNDTQPRIHTFTHRTAKRRKNTTLACIKFGSLKNWNPSGRNATNKSKKGKEKRTKVTTSVIKGGGMPPAFEAGVEEAGVFRACSFTSA